MASKVAPAGRANDESMTFEDDSNTLILVQQALAPLPLG